MTVDGIVTASCKEQVGAVSPREGVVAVGSVDGVVSVVAAEGVVAGASNDGVVTVAAIDGVIAFDVGDGVVARSAADVIVACAAEDGVVAILPIEGIVACFTIQNVVTGIGIDLVISTLYIKRFIVVQTVCRFSVIGTINYFAFQIIVVQPCREVGKSGVGVTVFVDDRFSLNFKSEMIDSVCYRIDQIITPERKVGTVILYKMKACFFSILIVAVKLHPCFKVIYSYIFIDKTNLFCRDIFITCNAGYFNCFNKDCIHCISSCRSGIDVPCRSV